MTVEVVEKETSLVTIEPTTALAVFTIPEKVDPILAAIKKAVAEFQPDVTTKKGRDAIASMAYKVAQSKTYLEGIGKRLADEYKDIPKKIDANRRKIKDELDALKDEVRKPLTEWEEAEKARVRGIKDRIEVIRQHAGMSEDSAMAKAAITRLEAVAVDESFAEFTAEAEQAKDKALTILRADLEYCLKREAEQAELARLRAEAAKREQEDRDRRIAEEAAEKARKDAEAKAEAEKAEIERRAKEEREAAERRELELKLAAEKAERERLEQIERAAREKVEVEAKAERDRLEAITKAEREKLAAVEAERRKQEEAERVRLAEEARVKAEERLRRENQINRDRVHDAILDALTAEGIPANHAIAVVSLLSTGSVPFVIVNY